MEFSEYQKRIQATALYPNPGENFVFPTLGLAGEAGEVAEKVKKLIRDADVHRSSDVSEADKQELTKELGDVLWYVAQLATELRLDFNEIAAVNLAKTTDRQARDVLSGSGDNR